MQAFPGGSPQPVADRNSKVTQHGNGTFTLGGGGVLGNRISCFKTPPGPNLKKGGFWGGLKGVFRCAGVLSAETAPRPPKPPPNEEHSVGHLRTVGYAAQV